MDFLIALMIIIAVLLVFFGVFGIRAARIKRVEMARFPNKFPEGHFVGRGMAIFLPVGLALGIPFGNVAFGLPLGLVIGLAVGKSWEDKARKEGKVRPLTNVEKRLKRQMAFILVAGFLAGFLALLVVYFLGGS